MINTIENFRCEIVTNLLNPIPNFPIFDSSSFLTLLPSDFNDLKSDSLKIELLNANNEGPCKVDISSIKRVSFPYDDVSNWKITSVALFKI